MKWLAGVLATIGLSALLADLNDVNVCQWLARQLIRRAVQRLPKQDRPRWEEEWLRHNNDVPGRLLPLARAMRIFLQAGSWGRILRDSPPISEVLRARVRAAWQKLRPRPKAPQEVKSEPATTQVKLQRVAIPVAIKVDANLILGAGVGVAVTHLPVEDPSRLRAGKPMSRREFEKWMAQGQQEFARWMVQGGQEFDKYLAQRRQKDEDWLARDRQECDQSRAQHRQECDDWLARLRWPAREH
jgi:hypothetical protein